MLEFCVTISMCIALCFLLEGVETVIKSKVDKLYIVTHVGYLLLIIDAMIFLLTSGALE